MMKLKRPEYLALKSFCTKFLCGFCCIFFVLFSIYFFAIKNNYLVEIISQITAQSLPPCSDLPSNVEPRAGENCLYFGLPLCKDVADPQHRMNCADLIDLPLCSQIVTSDSISARPGRNCVGLCSDIIYNNPSPEADPPLERGVDYAIFNKDCVRFCDDVEEGVVKESGKNCSARKCHQVADGVDPKDEENCNILPCNLLTSDELNKPKFDDATKKYCDGDNLRCYEFTQSQLPYTIMRTQNPICTIHNCRPSVGSCGADETIEIKSKGEIYVKDYEKYVNGGFALDSNSVCTPLFCKAVITTQYRCVAANGQISGNDDEDNVRNSECDISGDGSTCTSNYCFKTVDCNLSANDNAIECKMSEVITDEDKSYTDPFDSWFYRPRPASSAVIESSGILRQMEDKLCYTTDQMEDVHNWGNRESRSWGLFTVDMGWFHLDVRSPGSCKGSSLGNRG
ncbi:MAG TPA: hypothetical protein VI861_04165, partial [Rickettsiales bacterium]|nr:hypothetical protein [Rickettsiales bacterium]